MFLVKTGYFYLFRPLKVIQMKTFVEKNIPLHWNYSQLIDIMQHVMGVASRQCLIFRGHKAKGLVSTTVKHLAEVNWYFLNTVNVLL